MSEETQPPVVFLSYSHDSKEHKEWVAKLAVALLAQGIEVLFDQYDLGPGDDVPKFMEHSVRNAGRVLMICTESYVRKADDGKGGVGYEAMIVTGELVRDLGTNKFIPVVRQPGSPGKSVPVCVSTRLYVDLSEDADWDEGVTKLVEEIHRLRPAKKPPLGPAPKIGQNFEGQAKQQLRAERKAEFAQTFSSPETAYHEAAAIINDNDRVLWRKLLLAATDHGLAKAKEWVGSNRTMPTINKESPDALFADVRAGLEGYTPFIACMLAAAESGNAEFAGQLGWIDTIYSPADWPASGAIYFVKFPETVLFITQALVGGMLMASGSGAEACHLAASKVSGQYERDASPIYERSEINGWPDTLTHTCTVAWQFLDTCIEGWPWIKEAFGSADACRSGITAYYMLMDFLNFVVAVEKQEVPDENAKQVRLGSSNSLCCLHWPELVVAKGYKLLLQQRGVLEKVLISNNLDRGVAEQIWPKWMEETARWLGAVYSRYWSFGSNPHRALFDDWERSPFRLG